MPYYIFKSNGYDVTFARWVGGSGRACVYMRRVIKPSPGLVFCVPCRVCATEVTACIRPLWQDSASPPSSPLPSPASFFRRVSASPSGLLSPPHPPPDPPLHSPPPPTPPTHPAFSSSPSLHSISGGAIPIDQAALSEGEKRQHPELERFLADGK